MTPTPTAPEEHLPAAISPTSRKASKFGRVRATAARVARGLSRFLASIEQWQFRSASERLQAQAVEATWTVSSEIASQTVLDDVQRAGWDVETVGETPEGRTRYRARSRVTTGRPADIARFAATQLRFALAPHQMELLSVTCLDLDRPVFYQWSVSATKSATNADRVAIRTALNNRYITGTEQAVTAEVGAVLGENGVSDSVWKLLPANAAAAADHTNHWPVTPQLLAGLLLSLLFVGGLVGGSYIPADVVGFRYGVIENWWPLVSVGALMAACVITLLVLDRGQKANGRSVTAADPILAAVLAVAPIVFAGSVVGEWADPLWMVVAVAGTGVLVAIVVILARPFVLADRYSRKRTVRGLIISLSAVVVLLNLPAAAFMLGADLPEMIGSVNIGTVLLSGLIPAAIAGAGVVCVRWMIKLFRRRSRVGAGAAIAFYGASVAALAFCVIVAGSFSAGSSVSYATDASSTTLYGLRPVCVSNPSARQKGAFWLVGTVGRTSILLPRAGTRERGGGTLRVDSNQALDYVGARASCPAP